MSLTSMIEIKNPAKADLSKEDEVNCDTSELKK